jgi:hypothetical protein
MGLITWVWAVARMWCRGYCFKHHTKNGEGLYEDLCEQCLKLKRDKRENERRARSIATFEKDQIAKRRLGWKE